MLVPRPGPPSNEWMSKLQTGYLHIRPEASCALGEFQKPSWMLTARMPTITSTMSPFPGYKGSSQAVSLDPHTDCESGTGLWPSRPDEEPRAWRHQRDPESQTLTLGVLEAASKSDSPWESVDSEVAPPHLLLPYWVFQALRDNPRGWVMAWNRKLAVKITELTAMVQVPNCETGRGHFQGNKRQINSGSLTCYLLKAWHVFPSASILILSQQLYHKTLD
jgi:hypothetical protein